MARGRRFLSQLTLLFVVVIFCSFGYLATMLIWGLQYEPVLGKIGPLPLSIGLWAGTERLSSKSELGAEPDDKPVEWRLFGKEFMTDSELRAIHQVQERGQQEGALLRFFRRSPKAVNVRTHRTADHDMARGQLKAVSEQFQRKLETSWPLNCHSGREGLFPVKYERFARTLQDYAVYHRKTSPLLSSNETELARVLVWKCSTLDYCGGLSDRMKGIAYALLLSLFSRRRLIVHWDDTYVEPNLIDWTDDEVYGIFKSVENETMHWFEKINSTTSYSESVYQDNQYFVDEFSVADVMRAELYSKLEGLPQYPYEFRMFSILGGTGIDNSEDDIIYTLSTIGGEAKYVFLSTNLEPCTLKDSYKNGNQEWIMDGLKWAGLDHLSSDDIDNTVGIVMRYLFRVKTSLLEEVARAGSTLALSGQLYSSVHIRTGFAGSKQSHESIKLPKFVREKETWEAMLKCAVKTANSSLGPSSPILLATDSWIIKHMAVSQYGGRFRTLDNILLHIDKMAKIPHLLEENEREGVISTWVDMLLLAESYVQVGGTSGYIWAAGLFCYLPTERKINAETCDVGY